MAKKKVKIKKVKGPLQGMNLVNLDAEQITSLSFFEDNIKAVRSHVDKNEELYNDINSIFQVEKKKFLSMDKVGGFRTGGVSLRDFAEVAKSLGSIRTTGMSGTQSEFNMKAKVADMYLKRESMNKDESDSEKTNMMLKELTARLHSASDTGFGPNGRNGKMVNITDSNKSSKKDMSLLDANFNKAQKEGKVRINQNEAAMGYDFQGIDYRYDSTLGKTVAVNTNNNEIIENYPSERIPEIHRVERVTDGVAYNNSGNIIENL